MRKFALTNRANLGCRERNHSDRLAIQRNEFNLVARATAMHQNDSANVEPLTYLIACDIIKMRKTLEQTDAPRTQF